MEHISELKKVLVLDDDYSQLPRLGAILRSFNPNIDIQWETSLNGAKAKLSRDRLFNLSRYDLILADMYLDEANSEYGSDFLKEASKRYPRDKLVLMSAKAQADVLKHDASSQKFTFLSKVEDVQTTRAVINGVIKNTTPHPLQELLAGLLVLVAVGVLASLFKWIQISGVNRVTAEQAPIVRILKSEKIQAEVNELLTGGLTPMIRDSEFMTPKAFDQPVVLFLNN